MNSRITRYLTIQKLAVIFSIVAGSLMLSACGGSTDVKRADVDYSAPYFLVNDTPGIEGNTVVISHVNGMTVKFYDDEQLDSYSIVVGDVINEGGDLEGGSSSVPIDVSGLTGGTTYDATFTVTDADNNETVATLTLEVTAAALPDPMFMVGDSTPGGWSLGATEMPVDEANSSLYVWEGNLNGGEIKFVNYAATDYEFCSGPWILATTAGEAVNTDGSGNAYLRTSEENCDTAVDNKWVISEPGTYNVTINTEEELVYFELVGAADYYEELYLFGNANPDGGDIAQALALEADGSNPALFSWTGTLVPGDFKIASQNTALDEGDWIQPAMAEQSLTATDYQVVTAEAGATDNQWTIETEATYTIAIDLENETIAIGAPYPNLYLVGDAAPGGWDLANATQFDRDATSPFIFTTNVDLTAGEFKVATVASFDAGLDWIHPNTQGQPLSETAYSIIESGTGGTDYKWVVGDEAVGNYDITINLQEETILIDPVTE